MELRENGGQEEGVPVGISPRATIMMTRGMAARAGLYGLPEEVRERTDETGKLDLLDQAGVPHRTHAAAVATSVK